MVAPRLSIGTWAFTFGPFSAAPWPLGEVLRWAAKAGYDGVELNGFRPHPHPDDFNTVEKCRKLVCRISACGLGISGYAPDLTPAPPALSTRNKYLKIFRSALAFCGRCQIPVLRVDTAAPPGELAPDEYERRFGNLAANWRAAADEAAREGIALVWEFEPGFWLNKPSEVKGLVEAVGHPNFKLLFDTSHAYMGAVVGARHSGGKEILPGGLSAYAKLLAPHIGHLHLIDSDGTLHGGETSTHAAFGEGKIDFRALLSQIKPQIASLDWWCVDFCFNAETESAGRLAVPFMRGLMKELL